MNKLKQFFNGFQQGLKDFYSNITLIINSILLSTVYFLGVGLTSILAKLFGKHFLEMKISNKTNSYWSDLNLKKRSIEKYYRRF